MTDFIPGEAYRLDIITADETVIVDSWQGQVKASVVDVNGIILVDVETGNLYGSLIGTIEDTEGNTILSSTGNLTGSVTGSVYDDNGALAFDGENGTVIANVVGNVVFQCIKQCTGFANKIKTHQCHVAFWNRGFWGG